jgi:hypothetical protein
MNRIKSVTLSGTLLFIDESQLSFHEDSMWAHGFLDRAFSCIALQRCLLVTRDYENLVGE